MTTVLPVNTLHKEFKFVDEICEHLDSHGWLYAPGDAQDYDRARALFPADVVAWVQATQPKAWDALSKNHGPSAETVLLDRLRKSLDDRGTLDVLRNGVEMIGLRQPLLFAQFKPALAINPETMEKYEANRLRVVREVYLSHGPERLDLVFFLNGIPVSTAELKTDFTQSVHDAIDQYRFDRNPKVKGKGIEPLLSFPCGALVHFAVSNMEVHMTTKLAGPKTSFLPFNKGDNGAAGNPVNPQGGHRSAYLWEEVLERESWLEIIGRYLITKRDNKKKVVGIIFPRYHQLAATRKLVQAILAEGPGGKYLFQHSAGSGKTNSIAWSAHFLADLHDENHQKRFGMPSSTSSAPPASSPPSAASRVPKAENWPRPWPTAKRLWFAQSKPSPLPCAPCRNWRQPKANASRSSPTRPIPPRPAKPPPSSRRS
jgi:type I restriction enzyme R subunit